MRKVQSLKKRLGVMSFLMVSSLSLVGVAIGSFSVSEPKEISNATISSDIHCVSNAKEEGIQRYYLDIVGRKLKGFKDVDKEKLMSFKELVVPDEIVEITQSAFADCMNLENITIPKSLKIIGEGAFKNCNNLKSVVFNEDSNLSTISSNAFSGCTSLKEITIPANVTSIGSNVFPGNVETITNKSNVLFDASIRFLDIKIKDGKLDIDDLKNSSGVGFRIIADEAFKFLEDREVTEIIIPKSVVIIGNNSFNGLKNLKTVVFPETLETIGDSAFENCKNLENASFDKLKNLTKIGSKAFACCEKLKNVKIPESVTSIGANVFPKGLNNISNFSSVLFDFFTNKDKDELIKNGVLKFEISQKKTYTIIADGAFSGFNNISEIELNGITDIGKSAFKNCENLKKVAIPETVTMIGESAFEDCKGLESFIFSNSGVPSPLSIGSNALAGCKKINKITIPARVASIGNNVIPSHITESDMVSNKSTVLFDWWVKYHAYSLQGNTTKTLWETEVVDLSDFKNSSQENFVTIADSAFLGNKFLRWIFITRFVNTIGPNAFKDCENLNDVRIDGINVDIGSDSFAGCERAFFSVRDKLTTSNLMASNLQIPLKDIVGHGHTRHGAALTVALIITVLVLFSLGFGVGFAVSKRRSNKIYKNKEDNK